ncbi:MAG: hypothetical protein IJD45_02895 [Clostridia bacterium]|nr:hypothetical protein [Clostridia bacterium]
MKLKPIEKNQLIPFILAVFGSLLMIITLFLPFSTATEDFKAEINKNPEYVIYEDIDLKAKDVVNRSMVDYAQVYSTMTSRLFAGNEGVIYVGIVGAIGIFALIGLISALFRKATPTIIFTILSFFVFAFLGFDFYHRGEIPSESYNWGFGYYIFYVATVITVIGAIWLFAMKHKNKTHE